VPLHSGTFVLRALENLASQDEIGFCVNDADAVLLVPREGSESPSNGETPLARLLGVNPGAACSRIGYHAYLKVPVINRYLRLAACLAGVEVHSVFTQKGKYHFNLVLEAVTVQELSVQKEEISIDRISSLRSSSYDDEVIKPELSDAQPRIYRRPRARARITYLSSHHLKRCLLSNTSYPVK
jgi:hypothetical protein